MIVYLATKADFRADILSNRIEEKILDSFQGVLGKSVGESELASWRNSLPFMDRVLDDPDIPLDEDQRIHWQDLGNRLSIACSDSVEWPGDHMAA